MNVDVDTTTRKSLVGTTLDNRYLVESIIGEGGMSTVYKARHLFLKKLVAVKVMQEHLADNNEGRLRFQREAQAVASLSHPNIISVSEFGLSADEEPYMVMDFLDGLSLADLLREKVRADLRLSLTIFSQVAAALQHAHEKGILHRDLKPSNVMLVSSERENSIDIRVVDFGLARFLPSAGKETRRLTAAGELVGSPYYMSPEQIRDEELDERSDIYSLGCMMYETLTGTRPFVDTNAITVLSMHLYEEPPAFGAVLKPNRIPAPLELIVRKCLEKNREKRFQSMAELSHRLQELTFGKPSADKPAAAGSPASPAVDIQVSEQLQSPQVKPEAAPVIAQELAPQPSREPAPESARQNISETVPDPLPKAPGAESAPQYTLRLKQPEFAKNPVLDMVHNIAGPLARIPKVREFLESFSEKRTAPVIRKVRVTGTKVLVAVLGNSDESAAEAQSDAKKYAVYYKSVALRTSLDAQEFLVLLNTERFDIVHLIGTLDRDGIFKDAAGLALRLSDVKRACDFAQVKLLWIASENKTDWLNKEEPIFADPSFYTVITSARGDHFPKFLSSVLSRLSRGDLLANAWNQVSSSMPVQGHKSNLRLIAPQSDVSFLP